MSNTWKDRVLNSDAGRLQMDAAQSLIKGEGVAPLSTLPPAPLLASSPDQEDGDGL